MDPDCETWTVAMNTLGTTGTNREQYEAVPIEGTAGLSEDHKEVLHEGMDPRYIQGDYRTAVIRAEEILKTRREAIEEGV